MCVDNDYYASYFSYYARPELCKNNAEMSYSDLMILVVFYLICLGFSTLYFERGIIEKPINQPLKTGFSLKKPKTVNRLPG